MESIELWLIAVGWLAVSLVFGLVVCPRLMRKAPGGNP